MALYLPEISAYDKVLFGEAERQEKMEKVVERNTKLLEIIRQFLSISYVVAKDRLSDKTQLWQLEQIKAQTLCEEIKKIIEKRQELFSAFKKSAVFSQDGYYALLLLLDITSFYTYDYITHDSADSFYYDI